MRSGVGVKPDRRRRHPAASPAASRQGRGGTAGIVRDCGSCPVGQVCGGSGKANVCCAPQTCDSMHAQCGVQPDFCGGTVDCGSCPTGQVCEGYTCVKPSTCKPSVHCDSVPNGCGVIPDDGCGNMVCCHRGNKSAAFCCTVDDPGLN